MREPFFKSTSRLADLLIKAHQLILVLPRFGISFGFGDRSVAQVCSDRGVCGTLFLDVCNMYAFPDYKPSLHSVDKVYLRDLLFYLTASHHYYLEGRIPHIGKHLEHVAASCEHRYGDTLLHFYSDYQKEVIRHFAYEEEVTFPYIRAILEGGDIQHYSMELYKKNHSNIEDKLEDLISILIKYLPAETLPEERTSLLFDLFSLSTDINSHTRIEEQLMVPAVEALERRAT